MFVHSLPPPLPSPLPLPPLTYVPTQVRSPSPQQRDVGPTTCLSSLRSEDAAAAAPLLSKGMWVASYSLDGRNWGWINTKGGPREWEAHAVCHDDKPR